MHLITHAKFHSGEVIHLESDVLHIKFNDGKAISVLDASEIVGIRKKMIGEKKYYPIVDMTLGVRQASNESKAWMAINKEYAEMRLLDILVVKGINKIKVKLYMTFFKPRNKTIIVQSVEEALIEIAKDREIRASNSSPEA